MRKYYICRTEDRIWTQLHKFISKKYDGNVKHKKEGMMRWCKALWQSFKNLSHKTEIVWRNMGKAEIRLWQQPKDKKKSLTQLLAFNNKKNS